MKSENNDKVKCHRVLGLVIEFFQLCLGKLCLFFTIIKNLCIFCVFLQNVKNTKLHIARPFFQGVS